MSIPHKKRKKRQIKRTGKGQNLGQQTSTDEFSAHISFQPPASTGMAGIGMLEKGTTSDQEEDHEQMIFYKKTFVSGGICFDSRLLRGVVIHDRYQRSSRPSRNELLSNERENK